MIVNTCVEWDQVKECAFCLDRNSLRDGGECPIWQWRSNKTFQRFMTHESSVSLWHGKDLGEID